MKYLIFFFLFLVAGGVACEKPVEEVCYLCTMVKVTDYCAVEGTIDEILIDREIKCEWTREDVLAYEQKNSFMQEEKCFTRVQICECDSLP